jgi:hypothetical protein
VGARSAGTHVAKVVAVSPEGISLTLTSEQVAVVLADVAARAEHGKGEPLSVVMSARELLVSSLLEDRTVSRSLLYGLTAFCCIPSDGGERELKEIASASAGVSELKVRPRVRMACARMAATVLPDRRATKGLLPLAHLAGLVEQDPETRLYRLVG